MDIAAAGVAAVVSLTDPQGVCREVRIALGAVAPTVVRAASVEALLTGSQMEVAAIENAAQAVAEDIHPIDDIRGTAAHRRAIMTPLLKRTLHYAVQLAQGADIPFSMQRRLAVEAAF
jgi:carbon-monoxide dehydrogenase medium subunit